MSEIQALPKPRYPMDYPVTLVFREQNFWGTTRNMSMTGMGLWVPEVSSDLKEGDKGGLILCIDENPLNQKLDPFEEPKTIFLKVQMVWKADESCGVQIESLNSTDRSFYESLLDGYSSLVEFGHPFEEQYFKKFS
jgi:hypothetical protein